MIDFHTHILPSVDDGSKNIEMTCEMLKTAEKQGIETVIASPHFYFDKSNVEKFVAIREAALSETKKVITENSINVNVLAGAEVYLTPDIAEADNLKDLCVEGTNCMLVELPANEWTGWVYNAMYVLRSKDIIPVLAHLERYVKYISSISKILKLLEMEVVVQINTDDIGRFTYNKVIDAIVKSGKTIVLGSDGHNTTHRTINYEKGYKTFKRRYGTEIAGNLLYNADVLLSGEFSF